MFRFGRFEQGQLGGLAGRDIGFRLWLRGGSGRLGRAGLCGLGRRDRNRRPRLWTRGVFAIGKLKGLSFLSLLRRHGLQSGGRKRGGRDGITVRLERGVFRGLLRRDGIGGVDVLGLGRRLRRSDDGQLDRFLLRGGNEVAAQKSFAEQEGQQEDQHQVKNDGNRQGDRHFLSVVFLPVAGDQGHGSVLLMRA
jgi:hypothetical protein